MRRETPGIAARHWGGALWMAFATGLAVLLLICVAAGAVTEVTLRIEGMT